MKKLLTLLTLLLALGLTCAFAEDEPTTYTSGDYKYILLEDGTAQITDYTGSARELTIPETLDGHAVTTIGDSAFYDCDKLTSITIPDSVTTIGNSAFSDCTSLKTVTVARGSYAEQYCKDNGLPYAYPDTNDWLLN